MNKIYKIVWNATLGTWVVASEMVKSKKKTAKAIVGGTASIVLITFSQGAFALGEGSGNGVSATPKSTTNATCPTPTATYTADIALGCGATATSNNSAQGGDSATNSFGAVAIGSSDNRGLANASYTINGTTYNTKSTTAAGTQTVAIGSGVRALKGESTAIGNDSDAIGFASIAIGGDDIGSVSDATKTGYQSVTGTALDTNKGQYGNGGLTGGYRTTASGDASMAIGMNARSAGDLSTAFGTQAKAMANSALAVGTTANASGAGSTALGVNSSASADKTVALGANSQATIANGIALGAGSVASTASGVAGYDPSTGSNSSNSSSAWKSTTAAASVGNGSTLTRQITGLAAGQQDTDAVNVAQLKQTKTYTDTLANSIANVLGGNASVTNGSISMSNIGGTGKSTLNDAIASVQTTATQAKTTVTKGDNIEVATNLNADGSTNYTITTAKALKANSLATGDTTVNNNGLTISNGPSITKSGINANGTSVTGVAAGTISSSSTDAVNGSQISAISNSTKTLLGGNAKVGTDGTVTTTDIGGTGQSTVSDAVASVKAAGAAAQATADKGLNFKANNGTADKVSLGETVTLADGTNTTATYDSSSNTYKYSVVDAPVFSGVVKANGFDASGQKITDVGNGTIGSNSTDAVTGGQISTISNSTKTLLGGNAKVGTDGTVTTTDIGGTGQSTVSDAVASVKAAGAAAQATADKGLNFKANNGTADNVALGETVTLADGTNTTATYDASTNTYKYSVVDAPVFSGVVKANGFDASGQKITDVGNGTIGANSTDAVNGGQISTISNSTKTLLGGNAKVGTDGTVTTTDIGGTGQSNLSDAVASVKAAGAAAQATADKGLNFKANDGTTHNVALGDTITLADGTNTTATFDTTTNTYKYSVVDAPVFSGVVKANGFDASGQKITDVGNGTIGANSTDAVTGSQISTISNSTQALLGGNAKVGTDGTVTTTDIGGTGKSNLSDAVASVKEAGAAAQATADKGLNFKANNGATDNVALGETVTLADGTNTTATYDASTNTYKYSVVDAPVFSGVVKANGFDASGQKVTDVGNGTIGANSTDAVTGGQISAISESTQALLGGNAKVGTDGTVTTTDIGGTGKSNLSDAVASVKSAGAAAQATADKGLNFKANDGTAHNVALGDTVTLADGTNTTATFDTTTNTYKYSVVDAPVFSGVVKANGFDASGQKVTDVGNGTIGANSTDAVTGGQISTISNSTQALLGGNAKVGTDGTVTTTDIGGTGKSNLSDAVASVKSAGAAAQATADKGLNFKANDGTSHNVALGDTITLADGTNTTATFDTATNTYKYSVVDAPVFSGVVKANGFDASGQKVTNVGNGTIGANSTDAVTGGQISTISNSTQALLGGNAKVGTDGTVTTTDIGGTGKSTLNDAIAAVSSAGDAKNAETGNSVASALGGGSQYDATTGKVSSPVYQVNGKDQTGVEGAIKALDQGFTVSSNGNNAQAVKAGDTIDIGIAKDEKNLTVNKTGNDITYALNRNLDVDSLTAGNTTLDTNGVKVTDASGNTTQVGASGTTVKDASNNVATYGATSTEYKDADNKVLTTVGKDGLSVAGGPSITSSGIDAAGKEITNLKAGSIQSGSTDAVTGGQVAEIQTSLQQQLGTLGTNTVQYATNSDGSVNYNSIVAGNGKGTAVTTGTDSYGNSVVTGGGTTISNVANGVSASDAVNKGQLDSAISSNITNVKDGNGNGVSVTGQVVNQNYSATNPNQDSLFLTYDKAGQTTSDQLTIGETVQKMNKEGVKFAHTNSTSGKDSSAGGENSTALGVNAIAGSNANNSVVIGNNSSVTGASSVAIGDGAVASGNQSISIGTGNQVTGNNSGAFGDPSIINGANSYSVGNNNTISTDNTFALGNDITQTTAGSVVLGNNSASRTASGVSGYTPTAATTADQAAITATTSTTGSVAVGDAQNNIYRQVTGVAAGTADSDAVNVAQLKAVDNKVLALKTEGNTISDNAGHSNASTATSNTLTDGTNTTTTTASGTTYGKADPSNLSSTQVNQTGLSFKDASGNSTGPSVTASGLDAGSLKVTNVQNGTIASNSKDAVNGGQVASISQSVANAIGGVQVNQDGTLTNPTYNIAGGTQTTVSDALNALNQAVESANTTGKDINVSKVTVSDSAGNSSVTNPTGTTVKDNSGNSSATTANGLSVQDSAGNKASYGATSTVYQAADHSSTTIGTNGLSFKDSTGNATGPSVTASGIDAGGKTITNVAAGVNSTDAVNKGQLDAAVNTVSNTVNTLSDSAVQYDKNADGSVNKSRVTLGDGTTATTLTNVADGQVAAGSKDAVNGGQLANVQSQVTANTNSINSLNSTVSDLATGKSGTIQQADKNGDINIGKDSGGTKVNMANNTGASRTVTGVSAGAVSSTSSDA
ncbi:hypothetical protein I2F29_12700, partial [Acinetobacter sp. FNA3]